MPLNIFTICCFTIITFFFFVPSGTVTEEVPDQGSKGTRTGKVVSSDG
jgi:hypothetical protein